MQETTEIKELVRDYWTKRAVDFAELKHLEANSNKGPRWLSEIRRYLPETNELHILDIGCGAGFFEIVLGRAGYHVTGIDLTREMISKAKANCSQNEIPEAQVTLLPMDAEALDFEDGTFDAVISRNLTWTLPHPRKAYEEWHRVLKKGGVLLNFDAEYAKFAGDNLYAESNIAHKDIGKEMKDACKVFYDTLEIGRLPRPQWDREVLSAIGFTDIETDPEFFKRVYIEKDIFYIPDPMFSVKAVKL